MQRSLILLVLCLCVATAAAPAQSANTIVCSGSAEGPEQLRTFERWVDDVWGRGRIELVAELVRPVYIRHELDSTRTVTAAAYAAEISAVRRALPGVQFEIHDCGLIGDRLWVRWTMTGTSAATGGAVRRMGMQAYRFDSGQLAETWMLMPPTDAVWPENRTIGKPARPAAAQSLTGGITEAVDQAPPVTVVIVRHPESALELTAVGRQRAELLVQTLRDTRFTHVFASHTTRARQTVEPVARVQNIQVVQLPAPGSMLAGQTVTDATSRQAAIAPIADAVLQLPAGSVVLIGANSDNVYGILNRLGVPVAASGQECSAGSMCVPCLTNACFPGSDFDRLWHLVIEAGQARPIVLIQTRYGAGWSPPK